jgi:hypothetical protein
MTCEIPRLRRKRLFKLPRSHRNLLAMRSLIWEYSPYWGLSKRGQDPQSGLCGDWRIWPANKAQREGLQGVRGLFHTSALMTIENLMKLLKGCDHDSGDVP